MDLPSQAGYFYCTVSRSTTEKRVARAGPEEREGGGMRIQSIPGPVRAFAAGRRLRTS
ncbi:MAG: hypothetical protein MUF52_06615 [Syntrophobacteraceae bacterium]|nr:hypothetical protein [Syntrophobacteraceae bacterium]